MPRPVALLDANVLYPARLRDFCIRLAIAGLYQARWSERILDECFDNIKANHRELSDRKLDRTRQLMQNALPDATVRGYEDLIDHMELPDPDDRHVLAAARHAEATFLVTDNIRDFPQASMPDDLAVATPDEFISKLIDRDRDLVSTVLDGQLAALQNPPMTLPELLDGLEKVGLHRVVDRIRSS